MTDWTSDDGYESDFEFPLWKLIRERAEQKDMSYCAAAQELVPEYMKGIRYKDEEFERSVNDKALQEEHEEAKAFAARMALYENRGA